MDNPPVIQASDCRAFVHFKDESGEHLHAKYMRIIIVARLSTHGDDSRPQFARSSRGQGVRAPSAKAAGFIRLLRDAWPFIQPQRWLLLLGIFLMGINRVAGLALPASTKFLVDNVVGKRQVHLLAPIALAVLAATAIQGVTSYTLTQILSKAAQRMIAALRSQVQAHIGRLPIAFHDANKTGALVTRVKPAVVSITTMLTAEAAADEEDVPAQSPFGMMQPQQLVPVRRPRLRESHRPRRAGERTPRLRSRQFVSRRRQRCRKSERGCRRARKIARLCRA